MNYHEDFEKEYYSQISKIYLTIVSEFKRLKRTKRSYMFARSEIIKRLRNESLSLLDLYDGPLNTVHRTLYYSFINYEKGFYYNVFENEMKESFRNNSNAFKVNISYKDFIIKLAGNCAYEIFILFLKEEKFYPYFKYVYEAENLEGLKLLIEYSFFDYKYDRLKSIELLEDSKSYTINKSSPENYNVNENHTIQKHIKSEKDFDIKKAKKERDIIERNDGEINKLDSKQFKIKSNCKKIFEDDNFYNFLYHNFITDEVSIGELRSFFLDHIVISKKIKFFNENIYAVLLFDTLDDHFFVNFNRKYLLNKQKFYTKKGNHFKHTILKSSKNNYFKIRDEYESKLKNLENELLSFIE